jgi:putative transposase
VRRAYKFRLYPTTGQAGRLAACLADHRRLYNGALEERQGRWKWNREAVRYGDQSAQLRDIRAACPEQARWSFSSQQATLRRLNKAFDAFFRRVKAGQRPGYPRYRGEDRFDSVEWPKDGDGCRWRPDDARVYLQGIGQVKVHAHRLVEGTVKTISVKREGRRWYLVLSCDNVPTRPLPATGRQVGVDLGVARFLTTSDGHVEPNPRFVRRSQADLAAAQQRLARKQRGSKNRRRAKAAVAEVHRRVRNRRNDFHHKVARRLVETCDAIGLEDLAVKNMSASASGTLAEPGTNVAAKRGLNGSILDAGWAQFASILAAKAEEAGRRLVKVNPRHTSQTCSQCDHVDAGNRVSQAEFRCRRCGFTAHADENAACNVATRAGLGSGRANAA